MKNIRLIILVPILLFVFQTQAAPSAVRDYGIDYQLLLRPFVNLSGYPEREAQRAANFNWHKVTELPQNLNMQQLFELVRDHRYIIAKPFNRRPTFLYPDDGCFARAELMNNHIETLTEERVQKIFAFGNLWVDSNNSPSGGVGWWYHVAPVTRVGNTAYVFDPSIEPSKPLSVKEWLSKMSDQPESLMVAICDSFSYSPSEPCSGNKESAAQDVLADQKEFLKLEWDRVRELGRNPEAELKDAPPWK